MTTTSSEPGQETSADAVQRVFAAWQARQARPDLCRLTDDRKRLIKARLREYSADDLCALIDYAWDADEADARFWRGENAESRTYLDLENLFRVSKLAGRVEKALAWRGDDGDDDGGPDGTGAVNLGPMAAFHGHAPPPARRPVQPVQARTLRRGR